MHANNCMDRLNKFPLFIRILSICSQKILLDNGADRNARDKCWQTPLHIAAMNGSLECARLLLDGSANVNASDRGGHTPLHHAVLAGHQQVEFLSLTINPTHKTFLVVL